MEEYDLHMVYCDTLDWILEHKNELHKPSPRMYTQTYYPPAVSVEVKAQHPLDAGYDLKLQGCNTLVLHLTNKNQPGGDVGRGREGREADFFRRSDYKYHLHPSFYPFQDDYLIVTPRVTVFKDAQYKELRHPFRVDIMACAPVKGSYHTIDDQLSPDDAEILQFKTRQIVSTAAMLRYNAIVLDAIGCDPINNNPPLHVAQLFKEAIAGLPVGTIQKIVFAVEPRHVSIFSGVFPNL